ncbi:hypothetical protein LTS17_004042 [Exophiala oligosperma]
MASNQPQGKPYTSLLEENGNFGDMFWKSDDEKRKERGSNTCDSCSMVVNCGGVSGGVENVQVDAGQHQKRTGDKSVGKRNPSQGDSKNSL